MRCLAALRRHNGKLFEDEPVEVLTLYFLSGDIVERNGIEVGRNWRRRKAPGRWEATGGLSDLFIAIDLGDAYCKRVAQLPSFLMPH